MLYLLFGGNGYSAIRTQRGFLSGDPIGARVRNLADEELSAEEIADQLSVFLTTVERYW